MRKPVLLMLVLALMVVCGACGDGSGKQPVQSPVQTQTVNDEADQPKEEIQIGFSIAGEGAFYDQLEADIEAACTSKGYTFVLRRPGNAQEQINDIAELLASGISVLVIGPADVDALETSLAECETDGVPVINIVDPINGKVSTLISPDYLEAGSMAAQRADSLFGEEGVRCLELKTEYDSFIMQLLSDGFAKELAKNDKLALVSEQYCGEDEEQAYQLSLAELQSAENDIGFIFAQSAPLARGAMRAIRETSSSARLVAFCGDMDIITAVAAGELDAAVFMGPAELAGIAVDNAGLYLTDPGFEPKAYLQLQLDMVTADNASTFYMDGSPHVQIKTP